MKKIAILGSTGSIGESTLQIVDHLHHQFEIVAIAAKSNIDRLEEQALRYKPKLIAVYDSEKALELKKRLPHCEIMAGMEGLKAVAAYYEAELVVSAMSGTLGLVPTLAAIEAGKNIGLANKEALVSGGQLVMSLAKEKNVQILPIDSEHCAIFQCLNGEDPGKVRRLILTSSGGPFRNFTSEQLLYATVDQALSHPTWKMGPKITIDSSTLMNKGLEMIEAHWLFGIPVQQIEIIIHPQSLIHSMVEFVDSSILAQMSAPNMVLPIQHALTYPERKTGILQPFDFVKHQKMEFSLPDPEKFRCLKLAYQAIETGDSLPCYMNAANEVLVYRFLEQKISWQEISRRLEKLMSAHQLCKIKTIDDVLAVDAQAREEAKCV